MRVTMLMRPSTLVGVGVSMLHMFMCVAAAHCIVVSFKGCLGHAARCHTEPHTNWLAGAASCNSYAGMSCIDHSALG